MSSKVVDGRDPIGGVARASCCREVPGSPLTEQVHALILERAWSPE